MAAKVLRNESDVTTLLIATTKKYKSLIYTRWQKKKKKKILNTFEMNSILKILLDSVAHSKNEPLIRLDIGPRSTKRSIDQLPNM
jgi:hypothetical protein